jgi:hypothetical protein
MTHYPEEQARRDSVPTTIEIQWQTTIVETHRVAIPFDQLQPATQLAYLKGEPEFDEDKICGQVENSGNVDESTVTDRTVLAITAVLPGF